MQFDVIAVFPWIAGASTEEGVLRKARQSGLIQVRLHNLRDHAEGLNGRIDDEPYGGGAGMVLKPEPLFSAVEHVRTRFPAEPSRTVLLSPQGRLLSHDEALRLSRYERLILLCGRYEGVDQRVVEHLVDEELSIGDYVLSGGEVAAAVVLDTVARLVPGVVGNPSSVMEDSFAEGILAVPQYTRPGEFRGMKVPEVLLSGDHSRVEEWRRELAEKNTSRRRPDLMRAARTGGDEPTEKTVTQELSEGSHSNR
jgi:tRNA (guanine37-N1)-methyltransferase